MIDKLFPQPVTNAYQGQAVAKWVFTLVTILTIARSLAHILLPDGGAQSIATIPLDEFTANGRPRPFTCLPFGDCRSYCWGCFTWSFSGATSR